MQNLFFKGIREKSVASFWEINSQQPTDCLFTSRHLTDSSLLFFIALTNVNFQLFSSFKSWRLVQYLGNCLKWRCSILYFRRLWSRQAQLFCPTIYATSWLIFLSRFDCWDVTRWTADCTKKLKPYLDDFNGMYNRVFLDGTPAFVNGDDLSQAEIPVFRQLSSKYSLDRVFWYLWGPSDDINYTNDAD